MTDKPALKNREFDRRFLLGTALKGIAIGAVGGPMLSACGNGSGSETTFERIKRNKQVTVGFANEVPFAYKTGNTFTGEAVELLRAFFKQYGVKELKPVLTDFGGLIPGLVAKRYDVIGAGMYIEPERCAQVSFANPEYQMGEAFAVRTGNPKNLTSYDAIAKDSSAIFSTENGAIELQYAQAAGVPQSRIRLYPSYIAALQALAAGHVDAVGQLELSLRAALKRVTSSRIQYQSLTLQPKDKAGNTAVGYGAMGFRQSDSDLRNAFNAQLAKWKASGELLKMQEPFGFTSENTPPAGYTAADICAGKQPS